MSDGPHRLAVRVYYEDTDFSGVVYHASYLRFLERGRTEMLRAAGITQADLRDAAGEPLAFAVRHMTIDFIKAARMDDLIEIESRVGSGRGASLMIDQRIERAGTLLLMAVVKIALVGGGRPRRLPANLIARMM